MIYLGLYGAPVCTVRNRSGRLYVSILNCQRGQAPLRWDRALSNKNAALLILCATLFTDEPVIPHKLGVDIE